MHSDNADDDDDVGDDDDAPGDHQNLNLPFVSPQFVKEIRCYGQDDADGDDDGDVRLPLLLLHFHPSILVD